VSGQPDLVIHESRLILFRGALTANTQSVSLNKDWDNSVLQRVYDAVQQSSSAWMSVTHLLTDASQGVLKIKDFVQMLKAQGEPLLRKRLQMMDIARSVCRTIAIDADKEEFTRVATSFAGLAELLDKQMLRVAAAAEMPQTVLWGRSPSGLNATGESDTRIWYDTVDGGRDSELKPRLEQMIRVIMSVPNGPTKGKILDEWEIKFPPLWQPTEKERSEVFKARADALVALTNAQICEPEAAALHLAHSGEFNELDIETLEAVLEALRKERLADPLDENQPDPLGGNLPNGPGKTSDGPPGDPNLDKDALPKQDDA
jgi:phage-related protein (TIGR01555 family)